MPGVIQTGGGGSFLGKLLGIAAPFIPGVGGMVAGGLAGVANGNPVQALSGAAGAAGMSGATGQVQSSIPGFLQQLMYKPPQTYQGPEDWQGYQNKWGRGMQ
jgi:hypothetical protein